MPAPGRKSFFLLCFALSGFAGLIYESVWSRYLALFLGHAAYAQALVLILFLGGMAGGAHLAARRSERWRNLFRAYARVEAAVGILALVFHHQFEASLRLSLDSVLPALGGASVAIIAYKAALAGVLVLPPAVLLGMSFPLMAGAVLRSFPERPGGSVSLLYFANSFGGVFGVLVCGFFLIDALGLPGTVRLAGMVNLLVAGTVWLLTSDRAEASGSSAGDAGDEGDETELLQPAAAPGETTPRLFRMVLLASLLTGAASLIYEIGWIRMLSLVLGTSSHAFELMLAAFILGLALGGLWIRRRIDRVDNPLRLAGLVQLAMGLAALATLPLYGETFDLMIWLLNRLPKTDTGYLLFNLSSNGIALIIMFPATFCAGMTLPLFTHVLLRAGAGERSIGAVYATNTVGTIVGVALATGVGLPLLGLKGTVIFGAAMDLALGLVLLAVALHSVQRSRRLTTYATVGSVVVVGVALLLVSFDKLKMASGVYLGMGKLARGQVEVLYFEDGRTATVSVTRMPGTGGNPASIGIRTNGKPDASVFVGAPPRGNIDEVTMVQLGAIPLALRPDARQAAAIGLGSGITSETLLMSPRVERVRTIEIEPRMVEAARLFGERVSRVYSDRRSEIVIDDARSFFAAHADTYDIIVSEPSNPWISGVAGLFSIEFYRIIARRLSSRGIFVQWLPAYQLDTSLVISVLKAYSAIFADYRVYVLDRGDVLIVGCQSGAVGPLSQTALALPELAHALRRVDVRSVQDIEFRRVGSKRLLDPLLRTYAVQPNSDYYPVLDQLAPRMRFLGVEPEDLHSFTHHLLPARALLEREKARQSPTAITATGFYSPTKAAAEAMSLRDFYLHGRFDRSYRHLPGSVRREAHQLRRILRGAEGELELPADKRLRTLLSQAKRTIPYLTPGEMAAIWRALGADEAKLSTNERRWLELFEAVAARDAREMIAAAEVLIKQRGLPPDFNDYLVAAAMTGQLLEGDRAGARRTWVEHQTTRHRDRVRPPLLFRLLVALAERN